MTTCAQVLEETLLLHLHKTTPEREFHYMSCVPWFLITLYNLYLLICFMAIRDIRLGCDMWVFYEMQCFHLNDWYFESIFIKGYLGVVGGTTNSALDNFAVWHTSKHKSNVSELSSIETKKMSVCVENMLEYYCIFSYYQILPIGAEHVE